MCVKYLQYFLSFIIFINNNNNIIHTHKYRSSLLCFRNIISFTRNNWLINDHLCFYFYRFLNLFLLAHSNPCFHSIPHSLQQRKSGDQGNICSYVCLSTNRQWHFRCRRRIHLHHRQPDHLGSGGHDLHAQQAPAGAL